MGRGEREGGFPEQGEFRENAVVFASQHSFFLFLITAPSLSLRNSPTKGGHRIIEYMTLGLKDLTGKKHKNKPRLAEVSYY